MPISEILLLLLGLVAGAGIGWFAGRARTGILETDLRNSDARIAELGQQIGEQAATIERVQRDATILSTERAQYQERAARIPELDHEIRSRDNHIATLNERISTVEKDLADASSALDNERANFMEQRKLIDEAREKMSDAFKALSSEALKSNNKSFIEIAESTLKTSLATAQGDLEKRQLAISEIVKPVGEKLDKFADRVRELEIERKGAYSTLFEQVRSLTEGQTLLRSETTNLVRALRTPSTRGRWGEIQLKRVVEMAGMLDHCDFEEQVSQETESGRQRPDLIVKLPGDKKIIVDAKVPLAAYLEALEATDDAVRREKMIDHARQVREHIKQLSRKSYWEQFEPTPEFVVLFLSGEAFLYAALEHDPALIEDGITDRVILATPTTLIAMLKAVAYGWRQESLETNAKEISELGAELYKRLATVGEHFAKLGNNLRRTVESYNESAGSIERSLLPSARKLKEHGVSTGSKEIPDLEQTSITTRVLGAPELFPASNGELTSGG